MPFHRRRLQLLLVATLLASAAARPSYARGEPSDPWEPVNRKFYALNQVLDRFILSPVSNAYGHLPKPLRHGLRNFSRNLGEPGIAVNDLLQGHPKTAAKTVGRFTINSTVGLAGVIDVAKKGGLPRHDNDFGTTIGRWGAEPGPYMFLPLLGPSDMRDTVGGVINIFLNPAFFVNYNGRTAVSVVTTVDNGIDKRYEARQALETVRETSTDPYATLRSFYQQSREAAIHGENNPTNLPDFDTVPEGPELPDIQSEPEPGAAAPPTAGAAPETAQPAPAAAAPPESEPTAPAAPPPTAPQPTPEPVR
jgi:phospholipid-binding lipoprotein MlaA